MIQPKTQTRKYWVSDFAIADSDIEPIYNYFLERERPLPIEEIARVVMEHRVAKEQKEVQERLAERIVYQPKLEYALDDKLVFPAMKFTHGVVVGHRKGFNPHYGNFSVVKVKLNGKEREFAAGLEIDHPLNSDEPLDLLTEVDVDELYDLYGDVVTEKVAGSLEEREEFIRLGKEWFIKGLMLDINIGHLHLAEAVLEVNGGGPLPPEEIIVHLDLDDAVDASIKTFSLNYALLNDDRFDEVAPAGQVAWYLRRMEPEYVRETPERLIYHPVSYDKALISPQLMLLEQELDDEWSDFSPVTEAQPTLLSLIYPHRWAGTLPLSSRTRPLFPPSVSPRQQIIFIDDETDEEIVGWVVQYKRYVYGLQEWYEKHKIPVGGFISLKPGPEPGVVLLGYDRRKPQREWVRLANVIDNRLTFELQRRSIGCGYDDLLIVGTDYVAAVDAYMRRSQEKQRPLASLLLEIAPELAGLNPQNSVHAKTIYSAVNMLKRVPPGPVFAELARHPAFQPVGDHYWQIDSSQKK